MTVSIVLFTRDLRVHDNPVLHAATSEADQVIPLFVLDEEILSGGLNRPNKAAFLAECLAELDEQLRARKAKLVVRRGQVAKEVAKLATEYEASSVHIAADVSRYAKQREQALRAELDSHRIPLHVHDCVITVVEPGAVTPSGKDHFAVYTPYFRKWKTVPKRATLEPPRKIEMPRIAAGKMPTQRDMCTGDISPDLPRGGEKAARKLLRAWLDDGVADYGNQHDDLAGDDTSRLSPHLHFGTLSPTELVKQTQPSSDDFVRQVAWRDFHHQVLAARPESSQQDYRPHQDKWRRSTKELTAWKEGRTGYPIVDAGMRQLQREGWMHNRARLIVASFLTKTLYLDWRLGAAHFMDLLVDGDVANNQMNWQWVAGTGTDTRPNRVLNPLRQAQRYDPNGDFVRRYLPELADLSGAEIHQPWKLPSPQRKKLDYPAPIVDLQAGAERFLHARGKR